MKNPCKQIKLTDGASIIINVNGEQVRFDGLTPKQMAAIMYLGDFMINHIM